MTEFFGYHNSYRFKENLRNGSDEYHKSQSIESLVVYFILPYYPGCYQGNDLHQKHRGLLVVEEVNILPDHFSIYITNQLLYAKCYYIPSLCFRWLKERHCRGGRLEAEQFLYIGSYEKGRENVDEQVGTVCEVLSGDISVSDSLNKGEWNKRKFGDDQTLESPSQVVDEDYHEESYCQVPFHILHSHLLVEGLQLRFNLAQLFFMALVLGLDYMDIAFLLYFLIQFLYFIYVDPINTLHQIVIFFPVYKHPHYQLAQRCRQRSRSDDCQYQHWVHNKSS